MSNPKRYQFSLSALLVAVAALLVGLGAGLQIGNQRGYAVGWQAGWESAPTLTEDNPRIAKYLHARKTR